MGALRLQILLDQDGIVLSLKRENVFQAPRASHMHRCIANCLFLIQAMYTRTVYTVPRYELAHCVGRYHLCLTSTTIVAKIVTGPQQGALGVCGLDAPRFDWTLFVSTSTAYISAHPLGRCETNFSL
jgi:hypothetical protein